MLLGLYRENCEAAKRDEKPPYTILIVTHELNEAIFVGDRVVGLSQYWDWKAEEKTHPGATIVYDKKAPVFRPDDARNTADFNAQREEIHRAVFNTESNNPRDRFHTFWEDVEAGRVEGVLQ
jgi:ABC-type nitrate/sulfonate/bicarbonate transport system ATPase subunit